jgi:hypothetical protein
MKKICSVEGCAKNCFGHGYCQKHYVQIRNHGKILERTMFDRNEITDKGAYLEVTLYDFHGNETGKMKADKDDIEIIKSHKWHISRNSGGGYVKSSVGRKLVRFHRLVLGITNNGQIDHINHDKLDNRKKNLRIVSCSQNQMNRMNVAGYCEFKGKWMARINVNSKPIYLGYFENKEDAIQARKEAEKKYFKDFAFKRQMDIC